MKKAMLYAVSLMLVFGMCISLSSCGNDHDGEYDTDKNGKVTDDGTENDNATDDNGVVGDIVTGVGDAVSGVGDAVSGAADRIIGDPGNGGSSR